MVRWTDTDTDTKILKKKLKGKRLVKELKSDRTLAWHV